MTVRKLDENGDIVTRGEMFLTEQEEVAQTIRTRLALYIGEYFRDIGEGVPWFEQILAKQAQRSTVESLLRARIAQTPDVIRLTFFRLEVDPVGRKMTVSAGALTNFGLTEIEYNG